VVVDTGCQRGKTRGRGERREGRKEGGKEGKTYLLDVLEEFSHLDAGGDTVKGREGGREGGKEGRKGGKKGRPQKEGGREGRREVKTHLDDVLEEFSHLDAVRDTVGLLTGARVHQQLQVPPEHFLEGEGREGGRVGGRGGGRGG